MDSEQPPSPDVAALVRQVQSRFARAAEPQPLFDELLPALLAASGSRSGFIGEVQRKDEGRVMLRLLAPTSASVGSGGSGLAEPATLLDAALNSDEPLIDNDVGTRIGGQPQVAAGLPWPDAPQRFCALPLYYAGERIGIIALADRSVPYDAAWLAALDPLVQTLAGVLGTLRLERERRRAEAALRESERRYRSTFELAGVGIAHVALNGRFIEVNDRFARIVGHAPQALMQMGFQDVTHPDDLNPNLPHLRALAAGTIETHQMEKRYLRADGGIVWAQVSVALARDAQGAPHHLVAIINDITERKQAQEALIAAAAAERAHVARTAFLSRMSHELRTPLNAVLGFAQLLRLDLTQPLSPSQALKVQQIERAGSRLLAMINDVLDLSRIESGSMKVQVEVIALGELLAEVATGLEAAAREAQVTLRPPDGSAPGPRVLADRGRLQQVLANLLGNAVHFNHAGGEVRVQWRRVPGQARVVLDVADTGAGMKAEQVAHLFEPFHRPGSERPGAQESGIGLVVTHRLVALMGGELTVDSEPGRGTTFHLDLPAAPEEAASVAPPDAAAPGSTRRILYAEDNPSNVELVRQVLTLRPQWALSIARSGEEALRAIRAERFDLLLLDMHLGDMTGIDVVAALQSVPHAQGIPRIALSADAMPDRVQAARSAGFGVYLTKPIDVAALLRCLDEHLAAG